MPYFTDVIGVVLNIQDVIHGKTKQNKDYTKRDIMIRDRTSQITVTLWYQTVSLMSIASNIMNEKLFEVGNRFSDFMCSCCNCIERCLC